jgi:hypothetical protein
MNKFKLVSVFYLFLMAVYAQKLKMPVVDKDFILPLMYDSKGYLSGWTVYGKYYTTRKPNGRKSKV